MMSFRVKVVTQEKLSRYLREIIRYLDRLLKLNATPPINRVIMMSPRKWLSRKSY